MEDKKSRSEKSERSSSLELLRIFAAMAVIVLHYFNAGIGGGMDCLHGTYSVFIAHFCESICFCAVDLFVMLSAFFLCKTQNRRKVKIISLFLQAAILRMLLYLVKVFAFKDEEFLFGNFWGTVVIFGYFLVFYAIVYFFSPLINLAFSALDDKQCKKYAIASFVVFSILAVLPDALMRHSVLSQNWFGNSTVTNAGSFEGYTVVNFFLCYVVGVYIRKFHTECKTVKLWGCFAVNSMVLILWSYLDWKSAFTYNNPLVIIEAALLILIFNKFRIESRVINALAKSAFTCYLIHTFFFRFIDIPYHAGAAWYILILHLLVSVVVIYCLCWVVHWIYEHTIGRLILKCCKGLS